MEAHKFWLLWCTLTVTTVVALSGFSNHANGSRYLTRTEFLLLPNAIDLLASLNLARDDSKVTENDPDPSVCGNLPSHYEGYLLHVSLETKSGCNCAITDGNLVTQPSSPNASLFSMGFAIDGCRSSPMQFPMRMRPRLSTRRAHQILDKKFIASILTTNLPQKFLQGFATQTTQSSHTALLCPSLV